MASHKTKADHSEVHDKNINIDCSIRLKDGPQPIVMNHTNAVPFNSFVIAFFHAFCSLCRLRLKSIIGSIEIIGPNMISIVWCDFFRIVFQLFSFVWCVTFKSKNKKNSFLSESATLPTLIHSINTHTVREYRKRHSCGCKNQAATNSIQGMLLIIWRLYRQNGTKMEKKCTPAQPSLLVTDQSEKMHFFSLHYFVQNNTNR